ncbi:MAG: ABC transporter permease [Aggregatilineales bacterium]
MLDLSAPATEVVSPINLHAQDGRWMKALRRFAKHRLSLLGLLMIILFIIGGIAAPQLTPYEPDGFDLRATLADPSADHLLGTDHLGRDVLTRLLYGTRISLFVGVLATLVGFSIGVPIGAMSGYFGGTVDLVVQRLIDVMFALPGILLAILLASLLGAGLTNVIIAIGVGGIPLFVRLMRGSVLSIREQTFVEAARALGASDWEILSRHILPNALGPVTVQATLNVAITIPAAAGLGFLGLGVPPTTPEWGAMLADGRNNIFSAPHIAMSAGVAISLVTIGFNFLGDGLREAFDPISQRDS